MIIIRGKIVTPTKIIERGEVIVEKERIKEVQKGTKSHLLGVKIFDIPGVMVVPGFIDIHMHGIGGYTTPENVEKMADWEKRYGTTGFLPTLACATHESFLDFLRKIRQIIQNPPSEASRVL